jgi:dihydropteroate synthase
MIDPGFGFDKTLTDNLTILKNIDKFTTFGVPVLAGISRKSMLGEIANQNVEHRAHVSVAAALLAVMRGARMVRVHDVRATVDALSIFNATEGVGL